MKKFLIALLLALCCVSSMAGGGQSNSFDEPILMQTQPSEDDICIAWVIYSETGDVGLVAARAVLDVVNTRMKNRHMTACQVVKEPSQFSGYHHGMRMHVTKSMLTWAGFAYYMHPVVDGCEYFHAKYVHPGWKNVQVCAMIGGQIFYKKKERK